jgi:hypothetical protein
MRTFQIIIGIILLLPGLCSLAFMTESSSRDFMSGGLWGLWVPCLLVSAFGLWLIFKPGKQSETKYFRDVEKDNEEPK